LPGGDFAVDGAATLTSELAAKYPFLTAPHANRLAAAYGTRAQHILAGARSMADLGQSFGATLTEAEVRYLMTEEFARTPEDVLWRRTKLGLALSDEQTAVLERFMASESGATDSQRIPPRLRGGQGGVLLQTPYPWTDPTPTLPEDGEGEGRP
jgi:glycerol-3-phosphate dehydrogenase